MAVTMPWATLMPWMSSGTVSIRTSMTFLPFWAQATASSAVKTTWPAAAPGEAGEALGHDLGLGPGLGVEDRVQELVESLGLDLLQRLGLGVMMPSSTMSTAMLMAAMPVRLPLRVWSMYSVPSSMVNSKSWTSL